MKTIWKYNVPLTDESTILFPKNAAILSVQNQNDIIQLWALVDSDEKETTERHFRLYGTGHPFDDDNMWNFIGTVQVLHNMIVLHLFEVVK